MLRGALGVRGAGAAAPVRRVGLRGGQAGPGGGLGRRSRCKPGLRGPGASRLPKGASVRRLRDLGPSGASLTTEVRSCTVLGSVSAISPVPSLAAKAQPSPTLPFVRAHAPPPAPPLATTEAAAGPRGVVGVVVGRTRRKRLRSRVSVPSALARPGPAPGGPAPRRPRPAPLVPGAGRRKGVPLAHWEPLERVVNLILS